MNMNLCPDHGWPSLAEKCTDEPMTPQASDQSEQNVTWKHAFCSPSELRMMCFSVMGPTMAPTVTAKPDIAARESEK